ncbi:MAG: hypothetical protein EXS16_21035 [Gemmataceae bacterium]|nr:hypothetical protein [Gemmataceae bacterium]
MHMRYSLAIFLGLFCGNALIAQSPATKIGAQKGWFNDLASARTLAQKTGRPMMVVFRCDP